MPVSDVDRSRSIWGLGTPVGAGSTCWDHVVKSWRQDEARLPWGCMIFVLPPETDRALDRLDN